VIVQALLIRNIRDVADIAATVLCPAAPHGSGRYTDLSGVRADGGVELDRLVSVLLVAYGDIAEPRIRRALAQAVLLARGRIVELTRGLVADHRQPACSVARPMRDERAVARDGRRSPALEHA
jgi:hypothetical protein